MATETSVKSIEMEDLEKVGGYAYSGLGEILEDPGHGKFEVLLKKHVSNDGVVDYAGFKKDESKLDTYLALLADDPASESWTRAARLAYWINVYNAFTIKLILKHYPVSSIMDIENGKPWDMQWIKLGEKIYSLNEIENEIIRPQFNEPRIHFAVNCAAKSCPPLANTAYTEENLESLLQSQTIKFINNSSFNNLKKEMIAISKIFEWYAGDFGNIVTFVNKYTNIKINAGAKVSYLEYDWSLNN